MIHCITKNLQSIRDEQRYVDFMSDLSSLSFDVLFLSETWRDDLSEEAESPTNDLRLHNSVYKPS